MPLREMVESYMQLKIWSASQILQRERAFDHLVSTFDAESNGGRGRQFENVLDILKTLRYSCQFKNSIAYF